MIHETWAEVKHIHLLADNPKRVRKVIEKANKQIKNVHPEVSDAVGIVFLSIARGVHRATLDDRIPSDIQPYLDEVERELCSGHSKSVAQAVVSWDDYLVLGEPPQSTLHAFRRRSKVLGHRSPRRAPTFSAERLEVGSTVELWIRWQRIIGTNEGAIDTKPIRAGNTVVTQLFRDCNKFDGGIRAAHAFETLEDPDALMREDLGGLTVLLAMRRVALGRDPYTLLLIAHQKDNGPIEVAEGYRLYDDFASQEDLAFYPRAAFEALLRSYGAPVRVGGQTGLFIPAAYVVGALTNDAVQVVEGLVPQGEFFHVSQIVRLTQEQHPGVEVRWAYAILMDRYRAGVRRHRR